MVTVFCYIVYLLQAAGHNIPEEDEAEAPAASARRPNLGRP